MSTGNAAPVEQKHVSGVRTVLRYTGIPTSWLNKRPKLPSRNWLIFLSVTSSLAGLYIYDRRQCKKIRQHYIDKVKYLSEEQVDHLAWPRKVTVYGAKWPGDEDYDQSIKYFRKYVKPILVAAAVDYDLVVGKRHGDIARRVAEEIRLRRRRDTGLDSDTELTKALPTYKPLQRLRQHELEGGIVIVGRPTFKEFMAGLGRGWTEGLEKVDEEEALAHELESDGHFDEPEEPAGGENSADAVASPKLASLSSKTSPVFSPLQIRSPTSPPRPDATTATSQIYPPPRSIPVLPPLLLIPFTNHIGISQIPLMIWGFFNQRHKVRSGAEAGYCLVMKKTRPIHAPNASLSMFADISTQSEQSGTDLEFGKQAESYYKKSLSRWPEEIEKARKKYYDELPPKLATARALARGTREPTKEETENPPPTEVELRAERLKKEQRWRRDLEGWSIVKPTEPVVWDDRFSDALRLFIDQQNEDSDPSNSI